jgi:hypothetical protein
VTLNVGSVQMVPNETIGEALRRAETVLIAKRDEARAARRCRCRAQRRRTQRRAEDEIEPGETSRRRRRR